MKKFLLIGLIVALALILVGGAGVVYAQVRGIDTNNVVSQITTQNGVKIIQQFGLGPNEKLGGQINRYGPGGMMGGEGYGYGPGGMMGGEGYGYGPGGMMGGDGYRYGPGEMMGQRGFGPGMMMGGGGFGIGKGIMHDYVISAFAETVGLTVDQVNTRLSNGEMLNQIAIAQGKTKADLPALARQVFKAALDKAVTDGTITQAQADLMLERMNTMMQDFGNGFDSCPMGDYDETLP